MPIWTSDSHVVFRLFFPAVNVKMNELVKKSILRTSLLYVYAFLGGCLFYLIERKPENNREVYLRLSRIPTGLHN